MTEGQNSRQDSSDKAVRALAFELKQPLISIARLAELNDDKSAENIQYMAEQTLMLIDSFLLHAQSEYGQLALDLAPANIGSVLYEVNMQMRVTAQKNNFSILVDDRTQEPVMTNRPALTSILRVFSAALISNESDRRQIVMRGYKGKNGRIGVGVFTDSKLTISDLKRALELQGSAHMPLSTLNDKTHVSLAIADGLCKAIGGVMSVKHMGRLSGLATELPRSEQLSFV